MIARIMFVDLVFKMRILKAYKRLESWFCNKSIRASKRYIDYMETNNPKIRNVQLGTIDRSK